MPARLAGLAEAGDCSAYGAVVEIAVAAVAVGDLGAGAGAGTAVAAH